MGLVRDSQVALEWWLAGQLTGEGWTKEHVCYGHEGPFVLRPLSETFSVTWPVIA